MRNKIGSSETTREAFVFHFDYYFQLCASQEQTPAERTFLEWFLGFTEGDGSFGFAKAATARNPGRTRPIFTINQKDSTVLYKIKRELGCGTVIPVFNRETGQSCYRYRVYKMDHIQRLVQLFNGNLVLQKVRARFHQWISSYNEFYNQRDEITCRWESPPQIAEIEGIGVPTWDSAWLAGFTDADGGFYASLTPSSRHASGLRLRTKFYIKQKGERDTLERIGALFRDSGYPGPSLENTENRSNSLGVTGLRNDIFQLDISRNSTLLTVVRYLDRFSLLTRKKKLMYVRWKRILLNPNPPEGKRGGKAYRRYHRRVASVGKIHLLDR